MEEEEKEREKEKEKEEETVPSVNGMPDLIQFSCEASKLVLEGYVATLTYSSDEDWCTVSNGSVSVEANFAWEDRSATITVSREDRTMKRISVKQSAYMLCTNPTASGTTGSLKWILCPDGTLTVNGNGAMPDYEFKVISIGCCADSIVISVPWSDYVTSVKSVVIEKGVTSVGDWAFSGCSNMTSISLPDGLTGIGDQAFAGSGLTAITIPNTVKTIGNGAFSGTDISNLHIPSSVQDIGFGIVQNSYNLSAITVDASNPYYSSLDGVLFNKDKTLLKIVPYNKSGNYTIPNSATTIEYKAFSNNRLSSLTIPASLRYLQDNNGNRVDFEISGFNMTDYLGFGETFTGYTVDNANPVLSSESGVLYNRNKSKLFIYPTGKTGTLFTVPNTVKEITPYAVRNNPYLTAIIIPNSVTTIGYSAIVSSNPLIVTAFSNNPPVIDSYAFGGKEFNWKLIVPPGRSSAYRSAAVWKNFKTITESSEATTDFVLIGNVAIQKKDINTEHVTWITSNNSCRNSRIGGYLDWRLPTLAELEMMYNNRNLIGNFREGGYYWTSTFYNVISGAEWYWFMEFQNGTQGHAIYNGAYLNARCVRTWN
jgi:hypothetical protein